MTKFGTFQGRREDVRFLTGQGRYVDDIAPKDALFAAFLRSPYAHGRIVDLDMTAARDAPGVHLVLDAGALAALGVDIAMTGEQIEARDGGLGAGPRRPLLAQGVVRHAGEAVAVVVADTLAAARDAAEMIGLEVAELPCIVALVPGGPAIHPEAPENRAFDFLIGDEGATNAALAASHHRISLDVFHNRIIVNTLEPRGCFAEWQDGRLHFCFGGQGVWNQKAELARMLGLAPSEVRVSNPDVGGGFGMKGMTYPEYVAVAAAARALGRPVRWMSDRSEAMLSDNAGRDLLARAEIGFDSDLRITAYGVNLVSNLGAYNSQFGQAIQTELFSKVLTGVYDIPDAYLAVVGVYTNTTPVDAYRGAGRPEANMTIERVMDHAARALGVDGFDLRRRNVIRSFPYRLLSGESVDCGDFVAILDRVQTEADVAGFALRRAQSAARGQLRGLGVASYLEAILGSPSESARVVLEPDGGASLFVGTQSNGQGHETVYTQMLAEALGLDADLIRIVQGDSDKIARGGGTGGSRSVTVQGTATKAVATSLITAMTEFLADELGQPGISFTDRVFGSPGSNLRLTMAEAAALARQKGRVDLLDRAERITLAAGSYPNGAHVAEVEIDPETGALALLRYTVVDDFGHQVAPELVAGQIHGGVAQGFGQAVMENAVYDAQGQLLAGSFMDYAMPRCTDLPFMTLHDAPILTQTNPLGMKGCGEAGTVGALGAISNAVRDALAAVGVVQVDMPFTPQRLWEMIQEARHVDL
jgi:carbon-monoxide dehydrogenase large subunit